MDVKNELNDKFLSQDFGNNDRISENLNSYRLFASGYARIENAIAVLRDLKERKSYIYYGGMAQTLGMDTKSQCRCVDSIWEDEIFRCISPRDMERKHLEELKFIHFIRTKTKQDYSNYYLSSVLTMIDRECHRHLVRHRVFYVGIQPNGSIRLALCLYNLTDDKSDTKSYICESVSGKVLPLEQHNCNDLVSKREKEILRFIDEGMLSKEISESLSISIHTVNRHRQNILLKLCASNSIEACRIAKQLNLI